MELEDAVEVADLEDAPNPGLGDDQPQIAVEEAGALQRADDDPETEGVDEIHTGEIEHEERVTRSDLRHHCLTQLGTTDNVEFTRDGDHAPRAFSIGVRHDLHTTKLIRTDRPNAAASQTSTV